MVIGVNSCCNENTLAFFQGHGTAWGQANNSIRSGISSYSSHVDTVGGSDIEMGFNDPYTTAQWLNNFMSASTCVPSSDSSVDGCFYNFGTLTISISGTTCATSESSPWRACDFGTYPGVPRKMANVLPGRYQKSMFATTPAILNTPGAKMPRPGKT